VSLQQKKADEIRKEKAALENDMALKADELKHKYREIEALEETDKNKIADSI
jgi:hypothetical protein